MTSVAAPRDEIPPRSGEEAGSPVGRTVANILVLGTADWKTAIETNQHHVTRVLAQSHRVTYVESTGLRRPTLAFRDVKRMVRRLGRAVPRRNRQVLQSDAVTSHRLTIVSPILIPEHTLGIARRINRRLLRRYVSKWVEEPALQKVLWTYTPVTYGLEFVASATVYHCVDLLHEQSGIDADLVRSEEEHLAATGAKALASSGPVHVHLKSVGFDAELAENVADVGPFVEASRGVPKQSRAVFAGNLVGNKVDFDLLLDLVRDHEIHLVLAGPISESARGTSRLRELLQVAEWLGPLTVSSLATVVAESTVGLVPYHLNGYTAGVFPLKLFEYLAGGAHVVTTRLPSIEHLECADVSISGRDEFGQAVVNALQATPSKADIDRRQEIARAHSWESRGREINALMGRLSVNRR